MTRTGLTLLNRWITPSMVVNFRWTWQSSGNKYIIILLALHSLEKYLPDVHYKPESLQGTAYTEVNRQWQDEDIKEGK